MVSFGNPTKFYSYYGILQLGHPKRDPKFNNHPNIGTPKRRLQKTTVVRQISQLLEFRTPPCMAPQIDVNCLGYTGFGFRV